MIDNLKVMLTGIQPLIVLQSSDDVEQCDQMAGLSVQYLEFNNNENVPK